MVAAFRRTASGRSSISSRTTWASAAPTMPGGSTSLEWGPDSPYAGYFDIDWDPDRRICRASCWCRSSATSTARCWSAATSSCGSTRRPAASRSGPTATHKLPICPLHYQRILGASTRRWSGWAMRSPACRTGGRTSSRRADDLKAELAALRARQKRRARPRSTRRRPAQRHARASRTASGRSHELIQHQHWRAAHFRVAADDINYRRFFNINELAGPAHGAAGAVRPRPSAGPRPARRRHARRPAHRPYRRSARSQGLSASACARRRRGRSTSWSRRSWPATSTCARTGRSRAPPATNSPIWCGGLFVDPAGEDGVQPRSIAASPAAPARFEDVVRTARSAS